MAIGTLYVEHNEGTVTYGFQDLNVWIPKENNYRTLTSEDNDKFLVTACDFETAKAEFWGRWRIFTRSAFGENFIRIEMRGNPTIIRNNEVNAEKAF
jgi:hypothetical protein